ncbi:MAG: hypothetical protein AAGJ51_02780, partial [Pseudomonadota bacterium]
MSGRVDQDGSIETFACGIDPEFKGWPAGRIDRVRLMMRQVTPLETDRFEALSDETWSQIKQNGAFFEADAGETLLELGQTDKHLLI